MQLMLNKNKELRYSKFEQISGHIWFKDFDWEALISLDMQPEYLPVFEEKKNIRHDKNSDELRKWYGAYSNPDRLY